MAILNSFLYVYQMVIDMSHGQKSVFFNGPNPMQKSIQNGFAHDLDSHISHLSYHVTVLDGNMDISFLIFPYFPFMDMSSMGF